MFRSSSEEDAQDAEKNEDMTNKQKDSNNVLDGLKRVQEDIAKLNASIVGMKDAFNGAIENKKLIIY